MSVVSFEFIYFLVRNDTAIPAELSVLCGSVSFRNVDVHAKASSAMLIAGVGVTFAVVPLIELAFATHELAFTELGVVSGFAVHSGV